MTTLTVSAIDRLLGGAPTIVELRPRYEGCNICTWIGFKHVNYLVEEAVLVHLRDAGLPARELYEAHGVGVDLVDVDTRILHALHADDLAVAEVAPVSRPGDDALRYRVTLSVERGGAPVKAGTAKVGVVLRVDDRGGPVMPPLPGLEHVTVERIDRGIATTTAIGVEPAPALPLGRGRGTADDPILAALVGDANAFGWRWRIPYFYCHFTERLQLSGYLRLMEEVVDLFLADRGVSIGTLLDEQDWIPVVPHSSVHLLGEALMEEDLYTTFTVTEVFKDFTYTARMDCYVVRDGVLQQTATGTITHGYAVIDNRRDWHLVSLGERMRSVLRGNV